MTQDKKVAGQRGEEVRREEKQRKGAGGDLITRQEGEEGDG